MLYNIIRLFNQVESRLSALILKHLIPPELCLASCGEFNPIRTDLTQPERDFGILWAVPKSRRTIEKRRNRKFGWPDHVWKPLVPKRNLLPCTGCGNFHEAGYLCPSNSFLRSIFRLRQNE